MKTYHQYPTRIPNELWEDLLAVQKYSNRSINSIIGDGCREAVRKTKQEMGQYRKDSVTIRSVAAFA